MTWGSLWHHSSEISEPRELYLICCDKPYWKIRWKRIYIWTTESLCCTAEIKHNIVNKKYFIFRRCEWIFCNGNKIIFACWKKKEISEPRPLLTTVGVLVWVSHTVVIGLWEEVAGPGLRSGCAVGRGDLCREGGHTQCVHTCLPWVAAPSLFCTHTEELLDTSVLSCS